MKNLLLFLLSVILFISSCHKSVAPEIPVEYTKSLSEAKEWFTGTWKLTKVSAMIPNPPVPNVKIIVSGNQIMLLQDEKQTDKVDFEIIETSNFFQLKTNATFRSDNWYLRNPGIQVASKQIFLDTGMAYDMPGYTFQKVN